MKHLPKAPSLSECVYAVKYRVIGETWNGIIKRERNAVANLEKQYPSLTFREVEGAKDYRYGVDYEVYHKDILLCGIQINPISYKQGQSLEIQRAKKVNEEKNRRYQEATIAPVLYLYPNNQCHWEGDFAELSTLTYFNENSPGANNDYMQ